MMKMKKLLAAVLALTMLLALAACGSGNSSADTNTASGSAEGKTVVTVATSPDFPPFESLDGSEVVGIEVDILQAITGKLGLEMQLEQMDFESVIPGVQAGKFDIGMSGITITADRQKNCDFSNPYFLANQVIVVNPGSDIQGKADLAGKTIAVQTGTTAEEYCMDNGYSVLSFASNNDAQAALTSGKADAWVVDNEAAARMAADQSLTVLDEAMTSEPYAFAFAKGSSLVDQVNTAELNGYAAIAFGCPAMGSEVLEEMEFQPMFDSIRNQLGGKSVGLFGSYGWGDGEWMRSWEKDCGDAGLNLVCESVTCCDAPDDAALEACRELGRALAK